MGDLQVVGGVKKLNSQNYNYWSSCISSYLQGQDLLEVVNGNETTQPVVEDANGVLRKWRIKAGKAMFILKTTVEDELLEHIGDSATPKEAWDCLSVLFSKKNDTKLQLLENELLSVSQKELTISQYFHKVKALCREIGELDQQAKIGDARMKRIIIHGLNPEFRSFVAAVQGWPTQPSIGEFENLLASQEALAMQMGNLSVGCSSKREDEALYVEKSKGKYRHGRHHKNSAIYLDKKDNRHEGGKRSRGKDYDEDDSLSEEEESDEEDQRKERKFRSSGKRFPFKCYKCGKRGHRARDCLSEVHEEGNAAVVKSEEAWDVQALVAQDVIRLH